MSNDCPGCVAGAPTAEKKFIEANHDAHDLRHHRLEEDTILMLRARELRQGSDAFTHGYIQPIQWWYARRVTSGRRTYVCYICGQRIDTESASRQSRTSHADRAIEAHRRLHLCEPEQLLFERKAGMD